MNNITTQEPIKMGAVESYSSDVAFTPAVKAVQVKNGSREHFRRMEESGGWQTKITPDLARFIAAQTSVFLATANSAGQPYIQHRGGPPGFLHVLDEESIGFVDFSGNRQYITQGNLLENAKAHLFLLDYAHRRRIKLWGQAKFLDGDDESIAKLMPADYDAKAEGLIIFSVIAWDANCSRHIPQRFWAGDVAFALNERDKQIAELQTEIKRLRELLADRQA